jgi:putative hydrolase of the HAD superfamily
MNRAAERIDAVVFDVGWVLVRLDYAPLLECMARAGAELATMPDVVARIGIESHECGEISGAQLIDNLIGLTRGRADREEIERLWVTMFEPVDAMFELARGLAAHHRVHLLSNVGDLHWQALTSSYALDQLGHGALPSFEARVMKPDERFYALAEQRFELDPARTVFIDDLPQNVAAARRRGWQAIQHLDPSQTVESLDALGVATHTACPRS